MSKNYRRKWGYAIWPSLLAITLLLRQALSSEQIEHLYSRGVFLGIRRVQGVVSELIGFPLIYLLLFLLAGFWIWSMWRGWRERISRFRWFKRGVLRFFSFLCALVFFFLWLWGFNYKRIPVEEMMDLKVEAVPLAELEEAFYAQTELIVDLRERLSRDTLPLDSLPWTFDGLEASLEKKLEQVLRKWGYPIAGKVKGRSLLPKGVLLHFSSSGVYLPWTGEGHVDAGLHPLQQPFVLAHELAHGHGFADEGICNFWAYLSCAASEDPYIQYAGHFAYWRYLAASFRRFCPENYAQAWLEMPLGVRNDLISIYENLDDYPDWLPRLRYAAYDSFLKVQGIKGGIKSYSRIVMLVSAYRKQIQGSSRQGR